MSVVENRHVVVLGEVLRKHFVIFCVYADCSTATDKKYTECYFTCRVSVFILIKVQLRNDIHKKIIVRLI